MKLRAGSRRHTQPTHQVTGLKRCTVFLLTVVMSIQSTSNENTKIQISNIFELAPSKNSLFFGQKNDAPCKRHVDKCLLCDDDNACTQCEDGYLLDIEKKPFRCISCPGVCDDCNISGCKACVPGNYRVKIDIFDRTGFVCKPCSSACADCKNSAEHCTTCKDYYVL